MNSLIHALLYASLTVGVCGIVLHFARARVSPPIQYILYIAMALRMLVPMRAPWQEFEIPYAGYILVIWAMVAVAIFGESVIRTMRIRRKIFDSESTPPESLHHDFITARNELKLYSRPLLISTKSDVSPLLCGVGRPLVAVPDAIIEEAPRERIRFILLHELSHLKSFDLLWSWIWQAGAAIHFFNPIVRVSTKNFAVVRELRCDDNVLKHLTPEDRVEYGHSLLDLVQRLRPDTAGSQGVACVVENGMTLAERIKNITGARRKRSILTPILAALLLVGGTLTPTGCSDSGNIRYKSLSDWNFKGEKIFSKSELKAMSGSTGVELVAAMGQTYGKDGIFLNIFSYKLANESDAVKFHSAKIEPGNNLLLQNGNMVYEIQSISQAGMIAIWNELCPDPIIERIALMADNGVKFSRVSKLDEQNRNYIGNRLGGTPKLIYNAITPGGQINFLQPDSEITNTAATRSAMLELDVKAENIYIIDDTIIIEYMPNGSESAQESIRHIIKMELTHEHN